MGNLLARYFDRLYTNVPEDSFHRITSAHPQKPESEDATKLSPTQRLLWSLELLTVTRGIGWNWRVSSFPKPLPATSRSRFVTTQLLKFVAMYAALHVIEVTCRMILLSSSSPSPGPSPPSAPSSLPIPYNLHLYIVIVFGCATKIYSHFAILILPLSALCVGLQVGPTSWRSPTAWPSNFGRLRDAYSIRRFWGITWHQQLRRLLGAPGAYLLGVLPGWTHLRASRGRWARLFRRYTLLLMSFFISGLVHAAGSWQVTRALGRPLSDGGEIRYFVLQGVAIVGEDLVCWVLGIDDRRAPSPAAEGNAGTVGVGRLRRLLGFLVPGRGCIGRLCLWRWRRGFVMRGATCLLRSSSFGCRPKRCRGMLLQWLGICCCERFVRV